MTARTSTPRAPWRSLRRNGRTDEKANTRQVATGLENTQCIYRRNPHPRATGHSLKHRNKKAIRSPWEKRQHRATPTGGTCHYTTTPPCKGNPCALCYRLSGNVVGRDRLDSCYCRYWGCALQAKTVLTDGAHQPLQFSNYPIQLNPMTAQCPIP